MVYTDGIHMIANTIDELHQFAKRIGLHDCYFENPRKKRHPHYDLYLKGIRRQECRERALAEGAILVTDREIVRLCKKFYGERII